MSNTATSPRHLILFDGTCGFCQRSVQLVLPRDSKGAFAFASLESELARQLLAERGTSADGPGSMFVIANWDSAEETVLDKSEAVAFIFRKLDWPWKLFAASGWLPKPLMDRCYQTVARNRHRLAGIPGVCQVPDPAQRDRFLG